MAKGFFNNGQNSLPSNKFPQIPRNPEMETAYNDYVLRLLEHVARRDDESYNALRKSAALCDSLTKKNLVDVLDENVKELIVGNESSWKFFFGKVQGMPSQFSERRNSLLKRLALLEYPIKF